MVVPHAGTWIEIQVRVIKRITRDKSFPTRERGLKLMELINCILASIVVPHAGTWIEINAEMAD